MSSAYFVTYPNGLKVEYLGEIDAFPASARKFYGDFVGLLLTTQLKHVAHFGIWLGSEEDTGTMCRSKLWYIEVSSYALCLAQCVVLQVRC